MLLPIDPGAPNNQPNRFPQNLKVKSEPSPRITLNFLPKSSVIYNRFLIDTSIPILPKPKRERKNLPQRDQFRSSRCASFPFPGQIRTDATERTDIQTNLALPSARTVNEKPILFVTEYESAQIPEGANSMVLDRSVGRIS